MKVFAVSLLVTAFVAVQISQAKNVSSFMTLKDYYNSGRGNSRIISGEPAAENQFPWQVAVIINGLYFCGGALIHPKWVLTAAHCVQGGSSWTVILGSLYRQVGADNKQVIRSSTHAVHHEDYNNQYLNNDVALIEIAAVTPSVAIQPIRLPKPCEAEDIRKNIRVTVSGWGRTSDSSTLSSTLNFVTLKTIRNCKCAEYYGTATIIYSTLCAVGHPEHSTCNGDSGGPLIKKDCNNEPLHVGVASFVSSEGCASGAPSGYVRSGDFVEWISENTGIPVDELTN